MDFIDDTEERLRRGANQKVIDLLKAEYAEGKYYRISPALCWAMAALLHYEDVVAALRGEVETLGHLRETIEFNRGQHEKSERELKASLNKMATARDCWRTIAIGRQHLLDGANGKKKEAVEKVISTAQAWLEQNGED